MANGLPVTCSNRASLPEVADEAALFFDPLSVEDIAGAVGRLALDRDLRDDLRRKAARNLERFSWESTARKTLEVYRRLGSPSF
jgi:glycosyltransferase involved in cell wall biosynthesis